MSVFAGMFFLWIVHIKTAGPPPFAITTTVGIVAPCWHPGVADSSAKQTIAIAGA